MFVCMCGLRLFGWQHVIFFHDIWFCDISFYAHLMRTFMLIVCIPSLFYVNLGHGHGPVSNPTQRLHMGMNN